MHEVLELRVHLACDEETGRWYVAESDVPGLRLEDDHPLKLIARLEEAVPELIELNLDEIIAACAARAPEWTDRHTEIPWDRPAIRPVFDSPLRLAHA